MYSVQLTWLKCVPSSVYDPCTPLTCDTTVVDPGGRGVAPPLGGFLLACQFENAHAPSFSGTLTPYPRRFFFWGGGAFQFENSGLQEFLHPLLQSMCNTDVTMASSRVRIFP